MTARLRHPWEQAPSPTGPGATAWPTKSESRPPVLCSLNTLDICRQSVQSVRALPQHKKKSSGVRHLSSIRTENRVKPQSVYKQTVVADENLTHFAARKVEMRAGVE